MNATQTASDTGHHNDQVLSENDESIASQNDVEEDIELTPRVQNSDAENSFNEQHGQGLDNTVVETSAVSEHNDGENGTLNANEVDELHQNTNDDEAGTSEEPHPNDDSGIDAKNALAVVEMNEEDEFAINDLFCDQENAADESNAHANMISELTLAHDEKAEVIDGKVVVTKTLDDSLEMVFVHNETPKPLAPLYNVKMNDAISGDLPFKENVSKT